MFSVAENYFLCMYGRGERGIKWTLGKKYVFLGYNSKFFLRAIRFLVFFGSLTHTTARGDWMLAWSAESQRHRLSKDQTHYC